MKKIVCLALALTLALSLFAGASLAEDRRVLTIASMVDYSSYFDTDIFREIEDELNIEIQYTTYDENSFAAMLSGGDLADIMMPKKMTINILESGLALNLDPYIEEYAPNMNSDACKDSMDLSRKMLSTDGGLYIIPPVLGLHNALPGGVSQPTRGYAVRWDWYKELGCPEINNDDDYLNVLLQIKEKHPTTENGDPTILFGVHKSFGDFAGYRAAFRSDLAMNTWANYQYKSNIFTNDITDGYMDVENSRYWAEMEFYNKIYRMGEWDEDNFTHSGDEFNAKIEKGVYCGLYMSYSQLYNAARKEDPMTDKAYVIVPSKNMTNYANISLATGNMNSYYSFVNKDTKNIDIVMKLYNYMYDLDFCRYIYSGKQGVDWDYDENGVPSLTEEALKARSMGEPYWSTGKGNGGHGMRHHGFMGYNPAVLGTDGYPLDLTLTHEAATAAQSPLMADVAKTYGYEYWGDLFDAYEKDFRNDMGSDISACITTMTTDDLRLINACDAILESRMAELIYAETDEEYTEIQQSVLEELADAGEPAMFEKYQAEWNRVRDIIKPVHHAMAERNGIELYPEE